MSSSESQDDRIARLTGRLEGLELRLDRMQTPSAPEAKPRKGIDWKLTADFLKGLTTLFLGVAGLVLTITVKNALEERRVSLAEGQAAEELMLALSKPGVERVEAEAAALGLSAYGKAAISPLLTQLESRDPIRRQAARLGLRAVAVGQRKAVCRKLGDIVTQQTGLFSWWTHAEAIQLAGVAECTGLEPALRRYAASLRKDDAEEFLGRVVATPPRVNAETVEELLEALDDALERLGGGGD